MLGYVPNLSYGYGKSTFKKAVDKLKAEHKCLRLITDQIEQLNKSGGFQTYILGKKVTVKLGYISLLVIHLVITTLLGNSTIPMLFSPIGIVIV